ncbi:MAG: hypothetical protein RLZZ563_423 [Pseudomonadota bacterium]
MRRREFIAASAAGLGLSSGLALPGRAGAQTQRQGRQGAVMDADIAGDLKFTEAEYQRRHAAIRQAMAAEGIEALIVTGTREWFQGDLGNLLYIGAPVDWEQSFAIFPLSTDPVILQKRVQFPYFVERGIPGLPLGSFGQSSSAFKPEWAEGRPGTRVAGFYGPGLVAQLTRLGLAKARIGVVSLRNMPADVYRHLTENLPGVRLVDAQHILMALRYYKSAEEQRFVRRSAAMADAGMAALIDAAKVGATDLDLYYAADAACARLGGPVGGFQLVGSGPWGGHASNLILEPNFRRTLAAGDMVIPEIGSNFRGYFTQLTVPVSLGRPTDAFYQAHAMCERVYAELQTQFRAGKRVREIDAHTAAFTLSVSNGEFTTIFGIQAGEQELTFWHDDYVLKPGAVAYLQPFFVPAKRPGPPFHVFGDAWMVTDGAPRKLHTSSMDVVII